MEIVIESDPYQPRPSSASPAPTYLRTSPQQQLPPPPPLINTNSAFYYATLPRGRTITSAETPSSGARRVDKSGLLEISDPSLHQQPPSISHCATLSRRMDRPVLLEAVPEVPDQCPKHRELLATAAANAARSMIERRQHLLGAETDAIESALFRRRSFATDSQDSTSTISVQTDEEAVVPSTKKTRVKFALDEIQANTVLPPPSSFDEIKEIKEPIKSSLKDCLGRLSPRQRQQQVTLSNIPDVIEAHGTSSTPASTTTTVSTTTKSIKKDSAPQGERAEAEGCEHTNIESVESYKGGSGGGSGSNGKVAAHNDNIQAVHVIILSEQLWGRLWPGDWTNSVFKQYWVWEREIACLMMIIIITICVWVLVIIGRGCLWIILKSQLLLLLFIYILILILILKTNSWFVMLCGLELRNHRVRHFNLEKFFS